jgi:hypothetical protein
VIVIGNSTCITRSWFAVPATTLATADGCGIVIAGIKT